MNIIVKDSKIHGKGVFANRDFKIGEVVLKWNPKSITKNDVDKLSKQEKEYVSFKDEKYFLMQPPERYVNHSCEPNTNSKDKRDVAIRDIRKGEEITSDYSNDLAPGFEMKCFCGNKNCKSVIKHESRH